MYRKSTALEILIPQRKANIYAIQKRTDSEMYHYYSDLELDRLDDLEKRIREKLGQAAQAS